MIIMKISWKFSMITKTIFFDTNDMSFLVRERPTGYWPYIPKLIDITAYHYLRPPMETLSLCKQAVLNDYFDRMRTYNLLKTTSTVPNIHCPVQIEIFLQSQPGVQPVNSGVILIQYSSECVIVMYYLV